MDGSGGCLEINQAPAYITQAPELEPFHSAYNAGKTVAAGFPELLQGVVAAKDKRKLELSPKEKTS